MTASRTIVLALLAAMTTAPAALASERLEPDLPNHVETPGTRPERADDDRHEAPPVPSARPGGETDSPRPGVDAASQAMPEAESACRERLRGLGVAFEEAEPINGPDGCLAPHPLSVSRLSPTVTLEPRAILTCAMAEASALFVRDHAAPLVRREFGSPLATIRQVSSYVCRPRNGSDTLSEHAFANALDWGSLVLADGGTIEVRAHGRIEPRRTRLIERLRQAACGPFRTVLGPGSDPDHADHFHFDMAERRNGGTFCQ